MRDYTDVLSTPARRNRVPEVPAEVELVVETADGAFCGAVVDVGRAVDAGERRDVVTLEDRYGKRRVFAMLPAAFLLDGRPVTLVRPAAKAAAPKAAARTASGSYAVRRRAGPGRPRQPHLGRGRARRRTARTGLGRRPADRGRRRRTARRHRRPRRRTSAPSARDRNAAWACSSTTSSPAARNRASSPTCDRSGYGEHVLVTGHPYIDVWQAVKPTALGIDAWPQVPRGTDWKTGICRALGVSEPREMWRRVLAGVDSFADVEVPLLRAVEELIDFVTA